MNTSDLEYDLRQLDLMESQLSQFDDDIINLSHLVSGLKSLLSCLKTVRTETKNNINSEWWTLEQVYAVALDSKKVKLSPNDEASIKEATNNLRPLIASAKKEIEKAITTTEG